MTTMQSKHSKPDPRIRTGNVEDVVSVETGRGTVRGTLFHNGRSDDRTGCVDYNSFHLIPALSGYGSAGQAEEQGRHSSYNPFHLEILNCWNLHSISVFDYFCFFSVTKYTQTAPSTSRIPAIISMFAWTPPTAFRTSPPRAAATICGRQMVQLNRPR